MVDNCGCCCFVASEASFLASKLGNKTDLDEGAILLNIALMQPKMFEFSSRIG